MININYKRIIEAIEFLRPKEEQLTFFLDRNYILEISIEETCILFRIRRSDKHVTFCISILEYEQTLLPKTDFIAYHLNNLIHKIEIS